METSVSNPYPSLLLGNLVSRVNIVTYPALVENYADYSSRVF